MVQGFVPKKKSKPPLIQASGKAISSKNAAKITSARDAIASGLADLNTVLEAAGDDEVNASNFQDVGLLQCSDYGNYLKRAAWYNRLRVALDAFGWQFEYALYDGEEDVVPEMIDEFAAEIRALASTYKSSMQISAAKSEDIYRIECSSLSETLVEAGLHTNKLPIEVKLFECNQVSEGIPAKGPGRRLYISRDVAMSAAMQVASLPLDADPTLKKHCNQNIVGTMVSATVKEDGDFWVRANLHPFNQPDLVAKIQKDKALLGASINAYCPGEEREIDGETVFYVTELTLLGANILYKDCATFEGTEIKAQVLPIGNLASDVPNSPSIAASKVEEEDMDELKELVTQQAKMLETLGRGVELLLSDRQAAIDAETAKTQAAALEQTIESRVAAMLANQLNPTGQPQRLTTPVLASVESVPDAALKVAQLEGSLQALSQLGRGDAEARQKMLKLRDELIAAKRSLTTV